MLFLPMIREAIVDLPLPLSPTIPVKLPSGISMLMSEIQKGRDSVRSESDWVSEEEMRSRFGVTP